jgi:hypothetical protein
VHHALALELGDEIAGIAPGCAARRRAAASDRRKGGSSRSGILSFQVSFIVKVKIHSKLKIFLISLGFGRIQAIVVQLDHA